MLRRDRPISPLGTRDEVERRIGQYVAELVPNGATIQLGIGGIPAATALALDGHRDLGIHTEMFSDAVVDLVEKGVVNGSRKERNRGKIVTAFLMGTRRCTTSCAITRWSRCGRSTSPTTPTSSARSER